MRRLSPPNAFAHPRKWWRFREGLDVTASGPFAFIMALSALHDWFWERVQPCPNTGCWWWAGSKGNTGYTRAQTLILKSTGLNLNYVHRYVHHVCHGPVPDGLHIDHMCDNKGCVNPEHIVSTTCMANVLRSAGPAALNARKRYCPHGHAYAGDNVAIKKSSGARRCRECSRKRFRAWYNRNVKKAAASCLFALATTCHGQDLRLPADSLRHWATVKATTEDLLHDRTVLYAVKRSEAATLRTALATCDSTKAALGTIASNDSSLNAECRAQYVELDKRTVAKSALPWWCLASLLVGLWLGSQK